MTDPRLTARRVRGRALFLPIAIPSLAGRVPVFLGLLAALSSVGCGGGIPLEECAAGTYDDDGDAETTCVAWRLCRAGEYVSTAGTAETDRDGG